MKNSYWNEKAKQINSRSDMVKDTVSDLEDRSKIITQYTQRLSDRKHERGEKNHINLKKRVPEKYDRMNGGREKLEEILLKTFPKLKN